MSTLAIVLIVIGALILIALLARTLTRARNRKLDDRRQIAAEHREEATSRRLKAEREAAAADEQSARARRQAAEAEERSRAAATEREAAQAHTEHASEIDPDGQPEQTDSDGSEAGLGQRSRSGD